MGLPFLSLPDHHRRNQGKCVLWNKGARDGYGVPAAVSVLPNPNPKGESTMKKHRPKHRPKPVLVRPPRPPLRL